MVFSGHDLLIGNFTIIGLFAGMFQAIFQGLKKGSGMIIAGTKNHQFFAPEIGPAEGGVIQIQRPKNVAAEGLGSAV